LLREDIAQLDFPISFLLIIQYFCSHGSTWVYVKALHLGPHCKGLDVGKQRVASNVFALPTHAGIGERRITRTAPQGAVEQHLRAWRISAP